MAYQALRDIYEKEAQIGGRGAGAAGYFGRLRLDAKTIQSSLGCGDPLLYARPQRGEKILDIGCGMGLDSLLASDQVKEEGLIVAFDFAPSMLKRAKENANREKKGQNIAFMSADANILPFGDQSFDLAISNAVIHLLPKKQDALKEIYRVLKNGGRFVFSDLATTDELPLIFRQEYINTDGAFIYGAFDSREKLATDLFQAGFGDIEIKLQLMTPYLERLGDYFKANSWDEKKKKQYLDLAKDTVLWTLTISAKKGKKSWEDLKMPCFCGQWVDIRAVPTVNVTDRPHYRFLLKNKQLNSGICPACGTEIDSPVQFVYHDMEKRIMLMVFPSFAQKNGDELKEGFFEYIKDCKKAGDMKEDYHTGVLFGLPALRRELAL